MLFRSAFSMSLGGKTIALSNLAPASATGTALAAELESRLRREDGGNTDISVSWVGTPTSGTLKVTDATGRSVANASLTGVQGTSTDTPVYTSGDLKVTAIDPNTPAADILTDITVAQAGTPLDPTAIAQNPSPYPRSSADYTLDPTLSLKATFGPDASPITVTANSLGAFALALNSEATFAQSYLATVTGSVMTVTAKDPTTANAAAITEIGRAHV